MALMGRVVHRSRHTSGNCPTYSSTHTNGVWLRVPMPIGAHNRANPRRLNFKRIPYLAVQI